jgi:ABC-type multidrug transport system ATPase subunit
MSTIRIQNLTKRYGSVLGVDDLSFEVRPGQVTGFLGPNGSGKTTTLRILLGLASPSAGTATIGGLPYHQLPDVVRQVGAALDSNTFHPGRSAAQHLRIIATVTGLPRRRVDEVLGLTGLADVAGRRVGGFSLGMRQRLSLAGALLGDPDVLVFDEPLNGLDPDGIRWLRGLLRELAAEDRTVFVSSHLLSEVAQTADEVVVLSRGRLVAQTPLADLVDRSKDLESLFFDLVSQSPRTRRQSHERHYSARTRRTQEALHHPCAAGQLRDRDRASDRERDHRRDGRGKERYTAPGHRRGRLPDAQVRRDHLRGHAHLGHSRRGQ